MSSEFGLKFAESACYDGRKLPIDFFDSCDGGGLTLEMYESLENNCTAGSILTTCYMCSVPFLIFNCKMEFNATLVYHSFLDGFEKYLEYEKLENSKVKNS
ncbi:hypothetical protein HDU92_000379, partial [Lobulomyces angularis]